MTSVSEQGIHITRRARRCSPAEVKFATVTLYRMIKDPTERALMMDILGLDGKGDWKIQP